MRHTERVQQRQRMLHHALFGLAYIRKDEEVILMMFLDYIGLLSIAQTERDCETP